MALQKLVALQKLIVETIFPTCCGPRRQESSITRVQNHEHALLWRLFFAEFICNPDLLVSVSDLSNVGRNLHNFTLKDLQVITDGFSESNYLGEGGFGSVHKGFVDQELRSGLEDQLVAVKKLNLGGVQGDREWLAEVVFLGKLKHPNVVNLIGYCCEGEDRFLVYEYVERGDLRDQLFGTRTSLTWSTRLKIAVGAARCLAFLHGREKPVIHCDFKASNILLDGEYNAKISDFGLANYGPKQRDDDDDDNKRVLPVPVKGTNGYLPYEYIKYGHLTDKVDVYSFGVVFLELLMGRKAVEGRNLSCNEEWEEQRLVSWVRPMLKDQNQLDQLMDPSLGGQYPTEGAKKAASLAYKCLSSCPNLRPPMTYVVKTLEPLLDLNCDVPIVPVEPLLDLNCDVPSVPVVSTRFRSNQA